MPRVARPIVLTAIVLAVALTLAPTPAEARTSAPTGWLDALAHQIQQWTVSLWTWPAHETVSAPAKGYPAGSTWRPRIRPTCGPTSDPTGGCT